MKKVLLILLMLGFWVEAKAQKTVSKAERLAPTTFAKLGTPNDGDVRYCSDCAATAPCTGSGTGADAYRVAGAWNCNTGAASGAPTDATYIVQTPNATLSAEQALSTLPTGPLANTTTTGVLRGGTAVDQSIPVFCSDAGSTDTYACSLSPTPTLVTGTHYRFKANTANTGAATINFNSLGAITIVKVAGGVTTALADNDIRAGQWVDMVYDGTNMQMQSTLGNAPSAGAAVNPTSTVIPYNNAGSFADSPLARASASSVTLTPSADGAASFVIKNVAGHSMIQAGTLVGDSTYGAIYIGDNVSPSSSNYNLAASGSALFLNASNTINLSIGDTSRFSVTASAASAANFIGTTSVAAPLLQSTADVQVSKTITAGGTVGAQTINKTAGTVNFAATATSLVVTNSLVTANSIIQCTVGTNDATLKSVQCVAAAGSFTMFAGAAATAETRVNFTVFN